MAYSHREDFELPVGARRILFQPFTVDQWRASNFAPAASVDWFRDARYGMFIHFGLSAHHRADLSWGVCHTRKAPDTGHGPVPDEQWQSWPGEFTLERFDARQWVRIALDCGFKYLVLITKHHDGFHMWDTDESDFKITNTPFGRDLTREVADACHDAGLPIGFYYSQRDWYHPDYMPVDPDKVVQDGVHWTLKPGFDSPVGDGHHRYLAYQERVVRELCTRYGELACFWWDALWWGGMFTEPMWDGERITRLVRELQPNILQNNRCCVPGDFDTPEGRLGHFQDRRPWESCICLTDSWSYSATPAKPLDRIVRMLINNACGDGNLLLSWGAHWDGAFDPAETQRLREVADWLADHGQTIFNTRGGPWKPGAWGGSTRHGDTAYLHITDLEGETLDLPALPDRELVSATRLDGSAVGFDADAERVRLTLPAAERAAIDTVVVLTFDRSIDDIDAIATDDPSLFHDTTTYGQRVDGLTEAQAGPDVVLDLGSERLVTGVRIERVMDESAQHELVVSVSADGDRWHEADRVATLVAELPIQDYRSGAWVPGRPTRFVRISIDGGTAVRPALADCAVYALPDA